MIFRILKLAVLAGAGMAAWKAMQQRQDGQDRPFLESALQDGVAMAEAARSAQLRGASAELRGLAQQLEHDHGELNRKLAEAAGVDQPEGPDDRAREELRKLDACQGEAYDRTWLRHMARGHSRALRMFQREVDRSGTGAALASQALPKLREHERRIRELQRSVGASSSASRSAGEASRGRDTGGAPRAGADSGDATGAMA